MLLKYGNFIFHVQTRHNQRHFDLKRVTFAQNSFLFQNMWDGRDRDPAGGSTAGSKIEQIEKQVNEVMNLMKDNVSLVDERGKRLEDLNQRADALRSGAEGWSKTAKKVNRKYHWKNLKMWLIIGVILVVIVIIIIAVSVGLSA